MPVPKYDIEELLRSGETVSFPITGWSMYPFLSDGDIVTVGPITDSAMTKNNVVLYRRVHGPLVLHRICSIGEEGIYLCGDNQSHIEGPLQTKQILGTLLFFTHNGKTVQTSSSIYKIKSNIWRILRPLRPTISKTIHKIKQYL